MDPKANNVWVETLGSSLKHGGSALSDVPDLLKRVLREEAWRCFQTRMGEVVEHEQLGDFIATPPLAGLGATVELVENICRDDPEALQMLRTTLKGTRNNVTPRRGNRRDYGLERLKENAPELHAEVLAGSLSAHAAMVQAGFRPKTFTVRADRPQSVATSLRRYMKPDDLATLARLLSEET